MPLFSVQMLRSVRMQEMASVEVEAENAEAAEELAQSLPDDEAGWECIDSSNDGTDIVACEPILTKES